MATPTATPDPLAKLQQIFQATSDNNNAHLKEFIVLQFQDLKIQIAEMQAQLKAMDKVVGESAGKAKPRTKKAAADATAATAAPAAAPDAAAAPAADAATAAAPAAEPAGDVKKFPPNAWNWFNAKFKADAAFRAHHLSPAILELMKTDELIQKRKTDADRIAPQSKFLWNHYKTNDEATFKGLQAQYDAEKAGHAAANAPAPQTKEAESPRK